MSRRCDRTRLQDRRTRSLNTPIKTIGMHKVPILLHPEVEVAISLAVARNADEAARLARGEDITVARTEEQEAAAQALANAEAFFEPEALSQQAASADEEAPAEDAK
jgi:large subunit ribosomal protein L9